MMVPEPEQLLESELPAELAQDAIELPAVLAERDRVRMDEWIDSRLEKIANLQAQIAENTAVANRRIRIIQAHTDEQNATIERQVKWLEDALRHVARAYPYPKGKTRKLPFGEIGIRTQKAKLVVDEAVRVLEEVEAGTLPIECRRVKFEVAKDVLNKYWESTGLAIPGTHVEPAIEKPFVTVKGGANA
jgi:hypothetical protein